MLNLCDVILVCDLPLIHYFKSTKYFNVSSEFDTVFIVCMTWSFHVLRYPAAYFLNHRYMDLDPDKLDSFFEASEKWNSAMNMSNSMAFISQFGVSSRNVAPYMLHCSCCWRHQILTRQLSFFGWVDPDRNTILGVEKMRFSSILTRAKRK